MNLFHDVSRFYSLKARWIASSLSNITLGERTIFFFFFTLLQGGAADGKCTFVGDRVEVFMRVDNSVCCPPSLCRR